MPIIDPSRFQGDDIPDDADSREACWEYMEIHLNHFPAVDDLNAQGRLGWRYKYHYQPNPDEVFVVCVFERACAVCASGDRHASSLDEKNKERLEEKLAAHPVEPGQLPPTILDLFGVSIKETPQISASARQLAYWGGNQYAKHWPYCSEIEDVLGDLYGCGEPHGHKGKHDFTRKLDKV